MNYLPYYGSFLVSSKINICEWKPYLLNQFSWFQCLKGHRWLAEVFVYTYLNMLYTRQVRAVAALALAFAGAALPITSGMLA